MTTRCVIVDDSHQFRSAAGHLLQRGGMAVVGMASNTAEAPRNPVVILVSAHPAEDLAQAAACLFLTKAELSGSAIHEIMSGHA